VRGYLEKKFYEGGPADETTEYHHDLRKLIEDFLAIFEEIVESGVVNVENFMLAFKELACYDEDKNFVERTDRDRPSHPDDAVIFSSTTSSPEEVGKKKCMDSGRGSSIGGLPKAKTPKGKGGNKVNRKK